METKTTSKSVVKNLCPTKNDLKIVTPVKVSALQAYLRGYDSEKAHFLVEGFRRGFKIPFEGKYSCKVPKNLKSAIENHEVLKQKIEAEKLAGRIAGPFASPPLDNFVTSPLGLVPKGNSQEFRTIHHLSYPKGNSVNDGIPEEFKSVSYQNIDNAVELLRKYGKGAYFAKTDIAHAYKIVPVHQDSYHLLGFSFEDGFYFDKTLSMGLSYGPNLFEKISTAIHWIAIKKLGIHDCVHVLDDFLFVAPPPRVLCQTDLNRFLEMANNIGIPIKIEKTFQPSTCMVFLGLELDSEQMEIRLPVDKMIKIKSLLAEFRQKKRATLRELQSLIGVLNFACAAVVPGRTFLRRIIDLTKGLKAANHFRKLTNEAKADIKVWEVFMENFNGTCILLPSEWESSVTLNLYTDSSNIGFGGYLGCQWFAQKWPEEFKKFHITVKELFPIVLAVELWGHILKNRRIKFHTDNIAVMYSINRKSSKDRYIMKLLRRLVVQAMKYNIVFESVHIPGFQNIIADKMSRFQVSDLKEVAPHLEEVPVDVSHLMFPL